MLYAGWPKAMAAMGVAEQQATTARTLVEHVGAHWVGAAVIVDALSGGLERHELEVRSLAMSHDLRM